MSELAAVTGRHKGSRAHIHRGADRAGQKWSGVGAPQICLILTAHCQGEIFQQLEATIGFLTTVFVADYLNLGAINNCVV